MDSSLRALAKVDWDFADYISSRFPADINSLHWYPGVFVPQIPSILVETLSEAGDVVCDPFAGSGIALVEAARLGRRFVGCDSNPSAVEIAAAKFQALSEASPSWFESEAQAVRKLSPIRNPQAYCKKACVDPEVFRWYESQTLGELCAIHNYVRSLGTQRLPVLRKVLFSSILNRCCSQREHYTYITDSCFPKTLVHRPARDLLMAQIDLTSRAVLEAHARFQALHGRKWKHEGTLRCGDARELGWIDDSSVDFIVTSPPYLAVNDYTRSMRLTWLFFPSLLLNDAIAAEIGTRRKRHRRNAMTEYISDMRRCFSEMARILKQSGYLCIVLGQGRGAVSKQARLTELFVDTLSEEHGFVVKFRESRRLKFRRIQVPGVGNEEILVLKRE